MFDKKVYQNQWCKDNPEYMKKYMKKYRRDNREKILEQNKIWQKNNPEYMKEYKKQYHIDNIEKIKDHKKEYNNNRYKIDLKFNLNRKIGEAIRRSLHNNKNGKCWESLVGYKINDLIEHLNKTIPEDYTWQDYIKGELHIDHIIPISVFNFTKLEHPDFKHCWALNNLQLLPAKENLIKHNKITRPFQPALQLS